MKKLSLILITSVLLSIITQILIYTFLGIVPYVFAFIFQALTIVLGVILFCKRKNLFLCIISILISLTLIIPNSIILFKKDAAHNVNYVLHATGSIDGNKYLNSVQSLEYYLEKNIQLIEIDFLLTKDKEIICSHEFEYFGKYNFNNRPTYEEAKNIKILGKYDVLTFEYLIGKLKLYPNVKIIFDTKEKNSKEIIEKMINKALLLDFNLQSRFIIQVYSIEDYVDMQQFDFDEYWFTNYKAYYLPSEIVKHFEDKQNVTTYVMPPLLWNIFASSLVKTNKNIAVHTINDKNVIRFLNNKGVDIIYCDFI